MRSGFAALLLVTIALAVFASCADDPPPACKLVNTDCDVIYQPTFTNIYTRTIEPKCGIDNGACHSAEGRRGGLSLETESIAYQALLTGYVEAGDPACSEFAVRIDSPGEDYQMPVGDALTPPERCAILQWIENGAVR